MRRPAKDWRGLVALAGATALVGAGCELPGPDLRQCPRIGEKRCHPDRPREIQTCQRVSGIYGGPPSLLWLTEFGPAFDPGVCEPGNVCTEENGAPSCVPDPAYRCSNFGATRCEPIDGYEVFAAIERCQPDGGVWRRDGKCSASCAEGDAGAFCVVSSHCSELGTTRCEDGGAGVEVCADTVPQASWQHARDCDPGTACLIRNELALCRQPASDAGVAP